MTASPQVLQPGAGPVRAPHYVRADPERVLWGRLPCSSDTPVLSVDAGDEVTFDTVSHEGLLADQGSDPVAFFARHGVPRSAVLDDAVGLAAARTRDLADGPHVVTGPVAVRGARPGDLLAVTLLEALPRVPYGVVSSRHGRGALPGELPRDGREVVSVFVALDGDRARMPRRARPGAATALADPGRPAAPGDRDRTPDDVTFPVAPFLGIVGVATAGVERPHSVPPGPHGGNLDIATLGVGATLFLPVQAPGALVYVGDPHLAQGDGEVALTALEASLRVTVRCDLLPAGDPLATFGAAHGPFGRTAAHWVPTGLDVDLREAMRKAVRAALALLETRYGMDREHAYAYLSAAGDFHVSQVVDQVCGVHGLLRRADFGD